MFDKIGGRKFIMGIVVMLVGAAIEMNRADGLSTEMAALITMIYATFSASNTLVTNKQLSVQTSEGPATLAPIPQPEEQPESATANTEVDQIKQQLDQLGPLLSQFGSELASLKNNQTIHSQSLNTVQKAISAVLTKQ